MNKKKEDLNMSANSGNRKYSNYEGYSDSTAGFVADKLDRENPMITRSLHDTDLDLVKLARNWSIKR